jgi:hypothetical protein
VEASAPAFLTISNAQPKFWCRVADVDLHAILRTYGQGRNVARIVANVAPDTFDDVVKQARPGRPVRVALRSGAERGEKERVSTMTLEDVLNRAGQMNGVERWTLWIACGAHQPDSLPRTETGGAKRPRYCPTCWTAFSADGVVWNPACLPPQRDV